MRVMSGEGVRPLADTATLQLEIEGSVMTSYRAT